MTFLFLNLGGGEIMVVLLFVLLFFGSKSIPDLARGLGKGLREIREATENIKHEIEKGASEIQNSPQKASDDIKETIKEHQSNTTTPLDQQTDV
jgi:sec-independent protein translocase protein TatA